MDDKASNDADLEAFSQALSAAKSLNDTFSWPISQYNFQSIHENVSVSIIRFEVCMNIPLCFQGF
jgi:hypothetical protein